MHRIMSAERESILGPAVTETFQMSTIFLEWQAEHVPRSSLRSEEPPALP